MKNGYIYNGKGYQVMVLPILDELFSNPTNFTFSIIIFDWLISEMRKRGVLQGIDVEIIKVDYMGAYPCLGINYHDPNTAINKEASIEETVRSILHQKTTYDFVQYVMSTSKNWDEMTKQIMK